MDSKRLILFIALSLGTIVLWEKYFAPATPPAPVASSAPASAEVPQAAASAAGTPTSGSMARAQRVSVDTGLFRAEIDTQGGDLRQLVLKHFDDAVDSSKPFTLLTDTAAHTYVAQTGLVAASNPALPTHKTLFTASQPSYTLQGEQLEVKLSAAPANGVQVDKVYTFKKDSYQIGVRYDIHNAGTAPLAPTAYYRLLRDDSTPAGESSMVHTFTGPALYTAADKFQKVAFDDIKEGKAEYAKSANNGWVAMVQHYFVSAWLLNPNGSKSVCSSDTACRFEMKQSDKLFSAAALVDVGTIAPGQTRSLSVPLYVGPQDTKALEGAAEGLELVKDYGMVHIFASPLSWLLDKLHAIVGNWGWAIVLLTVLVKAIFWPLTAASYRSMAKMKALAPRLERLKEQFGDDRMKLQQAMMEMYKNEKVNPLGGCLPILIQIPVFIGLYWALLASVELRQAPWILWISDLSRPDPFYVLPLLMAASMFAQTFLNPPPTDPVQAKMMKIMPVAFSVMFFFFASGLVLYWVVNNLLSITQQYLINRQIANATKAKLQS